MLRKLLKAGAVNANDDFRRAAEELIHDERAKKHHLLANDLERVLYGEQTNGIRAESGKNYDRPTDRERGLYLIDIREPVRDLGDVVLSDENRSVLEEIILEQNRAELLSSYGLKPTFRVLFCGPPGCGKTSTAEVLAAELGLELAIIRFDAVVSSFLGETAANLRKVFDFLEKWRFVALFDEFDAIGKERDDPSEHGELKRVVNSFLQMIDDYRGKCVLVAATNHEKMLDTAIWRRFDEVLLLEKPNLEQIRELMRVKLRSVRQDLPIEEIWFLNEFKGFSHADIERVLIRAIKNMALKGQEFVTLDMIEQAKKHEDVRLRFPSKF